MKKANPEGRFSYRHSPRGRLPKKLLITHLLLLASYLYPAFRIVSCAVPDRIENFPDVTDAGGMTDEYVQTSVRLTADYPIVKSDLFIFDASGILPMEQHLICDGASFLHSGPVGEKKAVAFANCPFRFRAGAIARYEAATILEFSYRDDNVNAPFLSGETVFENDAECEIRLRPIMSSVELVHISNEMPGYSRLENPRLVLRDVAARVPALQSEGFSPKETFSDTSGLRGLIWERLPYDVGLYPQEPHTRVYCYPNENVTTPTVIMLECEIGEETLRFDSPLPPIGRDVKLKAGLTVRGKDDYEWKIY